MSGLYEKQMQWREVSKSKVEKLKDEKLNMEEKSFKPTIYSVPMKDFEGKAKELTIKQGNTHISRQIKARKEKVEQEKKLNGTIGIKTSKVKTTASEGEIDDAKYTNNTEELYNAASNEPGIYDEHIIELLERERKEWHKERSKLIHCIHLQQVELTERTSAGQEYAANIAKEFAKVIESFEERLIAIEENVQREVSTVRSIAESILESTKQKV